MNTFILIISLIPIVIDIVKKLEEVIPISGAGKTKLDIVIATIQASNEAVAGLKLGINVDTVIVAVTKFVNILVTAFNALGVFRKPQEIIGGLENGTIK